MFVRKRDLDAAHEEIARLRGELDQMRASLAQYQSHERELIDALVSSRAKARQMRTLAEAEAKELVDAAREQATSAQAQARQVVERARAEANDVESQARQRIAAVESEIARLRKVHGELSASLQQSLAALSPVIPDAGALAPTPAASVARQVLAPPVPAPPWTAAQSKIESGSPPTRTAATASAYPPAPVSATEPTLAILDRLRALLSLLQTRKGAVIVAVAAVVILSLAARVGVPAVWRDGPTASKSSPDDAETAFTTAQTHSESGSAFLTTRATAPKTASSALTVALRAVRAVWLRAEIDGQASAARLMKAGEDLELRGSREVVVRVGDAGAVLVGLNGKTQTVLGQTGAVVTKRFEAVPQNEVVRTADTPRPFSFPNPRAPLSTDPRSLRAQPVPVSAPRTGRAASPKAVPQTGARDAGQMMAAAGGNDEADVLRAHEAYFEALRRGDSAQMSRLVADGFTATGAPAADESGTPYEISVGQVAADVRGLGAVVSGTASQHISGADGPSTRNQMLMFSEVWVKRDGQWQLMNVRFVTPNGTR